MKKLLIDSRVRKVEYEYLSKYFDVIKLPLSNDVYEEISGHSDIFYCKLQNKIICAPNAPIREKEFIVGKNLVGRTYPYDVSYNACQIGDFIIGSKYTDSMISTNITVKQGYTKCSICVTSKNSCITSDRGIDKILKGNGINSDFIEENNGKWNIHLGRKSMVTEYSEKNDTQSDFCDENRNDKYKKMTISQFGEHMLQKNKFYLNEMV